MSDLFQIITHFPYFISDKFNVKLIIKFKKKKFNHSFKSKCF